MRLLVVLLPSLVPALGGCSLTLPFDELSGGKTTKSESACHWELAPETRFETAGRPFALDVADFDGNGLPDIVLAENDHFANVDYATTEVQLGRPDRSFESWYQASKNSSEGGSMITRGIATGDVDKDGHADAVQSYASYDVVDGSFDLDRGKGDGMLDWDGIWTVAKPDDVVLADFDGDGWLDAAVSSLTDDQGYADEKLFFLWGDGSGSFALPVEYKPTSVFTNTIRELTAADLNADGKADLVLGSWGNATLQVLLGTSDRGMNQLPSVAVGDAPWGLAAADFDRDGKLDVACVNNNDNTVSILFGTGDGGLERETPLSVGKDMKPVVAVDLDHDGDADLAIGGSGEIFTLLNDGTGKFDAPLSHFMDGTPNRFAGADLDQNGLPDLAVSNLSRDSFSVFFGECKKP